MGMTLPVRVQGHDRSGTPWEEMATCADTSANGVSFGVKHHVVYQGQTLHLSLPLPKRFRRYDMVEPSYRTYAQVRNVTQSAEGGLRIGVLFLGKHPPKGWAENRGGIATAGAAKAEPASSAERRRDQRAEVYVNLRLTRDPQFGEPREETTVAENISRGGARVLTSLHVSKGEVVEIEELGGPFKAHADVKNIFIGKDNVPRLNLSFLNAEAPERLYR